MTRSGGRAQRQAMITSLRSFQVQSMSYLKLASAQRSRLRTTCAAESKKYSIVFLGTPQVATISLQGLLNAAALDNSHFEVSAVVSQPGRPRGRGKNRQANAPPTPVHQLALDAGVPESNIFTPVRAREEEFLKALEAFKPDLCVTAAYGNMLPQRFLDIPRFGTLNIHPSLLPLYRGAAPVNRTLENGDKETGVSIAFTVLACDAGPILAQEKRSLTGDEQAPELLEDLFQLGTDLLVSKLPLVWSGDAAAVAEPQDESRATHAPKLSSGDAYLDFRKSATVLHNQVRGLAGWPGTKTRVRIVQAGKDDIHLDMRILRTRVGKSTAASVQSMSEADTLKNAQVVVSDDSLMFPCSDGSVLEVLELQPVGKRACPAKAYRNSLHGKELYLAPNDGFL